jgi:hypothetical protein
VNLKGVIGESESHSRSKLEWFLPVEKRKEKKRKERNWNGSKLIGGYTGPVAPGPYRPSKPY